MTKKQVLKIFAYIISVCALVWLCGKILNFTSKEDSIRVYSLQHEPEKTVDVMLVGCSEVLRGYVAPLAYEEQGFTSFPAAIAGMPVSLYKYMIKECERTQKPQLYVIEINGAYYKDQLDESKLRQYVDSLPNCETRNEIIKAYVPKDKRRSFYFSFEKYHDNWRYLGNAMTLQRYKQTIRKRGYSLTKNYNADLRTFGRELGEAPTKHPMSTEGAEYMRDLLEYLKKENITNVLFVRWAHNNSFVADGAYADAEKLIAEYNYKFVNFDNYVDEIGIDKPNDFADKEHLNPFGAEKMTKYFAKYIMENYDLDLNHSQKIKKEWDDCAAQCKDFLELSKKLTLENKKVKQDIKIITDYDYLQLLDEANKTKDYSKILKKARSLYAGK